MAKKNIAFVDVDWLENGMRSLSNSIKSKTGEEDALSFPDGMVAAVDSIENPTILEGVELELDLADGDQPVSVPDGYVVKSAIIKKPATLIPENIAKDVEIAGVVGTHAGGGGGGSVEGYATVTFMNGGEVLFSRMVLKGDDCPDPWVQKRIETPTKESTVQYDYTFNGWATADGGSANANALKGITEDKTLYAAFAESVRKYTVTYYDDDGVTVLHTEQVAYGSMPSYVPTKEGVMFGGWTPNTPVKGDTSYTATWTSVLDSGTCGNTAFWSLTQDGTLTIYGTGATSSSPWANTYKTQIQAVIIGEGITSIYQNSFLDHANLKSVTVPSTIQKFDYNAFLRCGAIESVYLSDIASWLSCTLNSYPNEYSSPKYYVNGELIAGDLIVPTSVTKIGRYVCYGWDITGVIFHNGVTEIGDCAFRDCKNITSLTIPASVTSIGQSWGVGSFRDCTGLESVVHLANVVGYRQYLGCTNLKSVTFGNGLTSIGKEGFSGTAVTSVTIPATVKEMTAPFYQCASLGSAYFEDTEGWKAGTTALASADLANPATAANYLANTYATAKWTNS